MRGPLLLRGGPARGHRRGRRAAHSRRARRAVARARCLPPASPGEPARLLVVPRVDVPPESLELDDLAVPAELEEQIKAYLEPRRLLTMRLRIETPRYQGVKVVAEVRAGPGVRPETVRERAEQALYAYLNPLVGGPGGQGWPFGIDLRLGDVYGVLHGAFGVQGVEAVHFFSGRPAPPGDPRPGRPAGAAAARGAVHVVPAPGGGAAVTERGTGWLAVQLPRAMAADPVLNGFVSAARGGRRHRARADRRRRAPGRHRARDSGDAAVPRVLAGASNWSRPIRRSTSVRWCARSAACSAGGAPGTASRVCWRRPPGRG